MGSQWSYLLESVIACLCLFGGVAHEKRINPLSRQVGRLLVVNSVYHHLFHDLCPSSELSRKYFKCVVCI